MAVPGLPWHHAPRRVQIHTIQGMRPKPRCGKDRRIGPPKTQATRLERAAPYRVRAGKISVRDPRGSPEATSRPTTPDEAGGGGGGRPARPGRGHGRGPTTCTPARRERGAHARDEFLTSWARPLPLSRLVKVLTLGSRRGQLAAWGALMYAPREIRRMPPRDGRRLPCSPRSIRRGRRPLR